MVGVEGDGHAKEIMYFASGGVQWNKVCFNGGENAVNDGQVDVRDFVVIYIPGNSALGAIKGGIGDTRVVWVEGEAEAFKGVSEEFVPEEAALDAAVEGTVEAKVEGWAIVFRCEVLKEVGADVAHKGGVFVDEFDDDKVIHDGVEICASDVSCGNVTVFVGVDD